eukprot:Selendium_serpulae@DN11952_c0_g1_i1.p1
MFSRSRGDGAAMRGALIATLNGAVSRLYSFMALNYALITVATIIFSVVFVVTGFISMFVSVWMALIIDLFLFFGIFRFFLRAAVFPGSVFFFKRTYERTYRLTLCRELESALSDINSFLVHLKQSTRNPSNNQSNQILQPESAGTTDRSTVDEDSPPVRSVSNDSPISEHDSPENILNFFDEEYPQSAVRVSRAFQDLETHRKVFNVLANQRPPQQVENRFMGLTNNLCPTRVRRRQIAARLDPSSSSSSSSSQDVLNSEVASALSDNSS